MPSLPLLRSVALRSSAAFPCHGSHRFSFASPCLPGPCHAVASRIAAFPCRRSPPQLRPVPLPGQSLPSLCTDAPRIALALLHSSFPQPCRPLRGKSLPSPFPAVRSDPTPLPFRASLCHASAPCINALPPPCGCLPFAALPLRCPAHLCRCDASLRFAVANQCLFLPSRSPAMRSNAVPPQSLAQQTRALALPPGVLHASSMPSPCSPPRRHSAALQPVPMRSRRAGLPVRLFAVAPPICASLIRCRAWPIDSLPLPC